MCTYSVAEDGIVLLTYFHDFFDSNKRDNIKDKIITSFNEPIHSIAIEQITLGSKDRSFLVGTFSGQLLYHHTVWFTQQTTILYKGDSSPVTSIKRCGNLVAWVDLYYLRVLGKNNIN